MSYGIKAVPTPQLEEVCLVIHLGSRDLGLACQYNQLNKLASQCCLWY